MQSIRWGIIGCGDVAEIKSGPGFQKALRSELIAVMRRNGGLAKDYAIRHNVQNWYDNAESLINHPGVDAVYIATPPSTHKEYALEVIKAGKPVYIEKPMALNYFECQEIIEAGKKANVPIFTAYYRRALPKFLKIKSMLDNGLIGDIRAINMRLYKQFINKDQQVNFNWRIDPTIAGAGYFFDLGSHMIDLVQFYFGPIDYAKGIAVNQSKFYKVEDIVNAQFSFTNGVQGVGLWCFNTDANFDQTEIIGSNGKISYSYFDNRPIVLVNNDKIQEFNIPNPKYVQLPLIQLIVNELLGNGKSPSTGDSGALTNLILDKVLGRI